MPDVISTTIAAILTLFVYSYLLRDNPLYRLAEHLLVGAGVAYAMVVAVYDVLLPRLFEPLRTDAMGQPDLFIPLVLGLLLLVKAVPRGSRLGNPSLAYLVGTGLALAVGGALVGTLIPQVQATILPVLPVGGLSPLAALANAVVIIGTLTVLFSFLYLRAPLASTGEDEADPDRAPVWYTMGRWFLMIALGGIFGGLTLTYVSLLVGRWDFLINDWLLPLIGL